MGANKYRNYYMKKTAPLKNSLKTITVNLFTALKQLYLLLIFMLMSSSTAFASHDIKDTFWSAQQKGANIFNRSVTLEDIKAAKEYGIKFIRLAPDKFLSSHRDFLIGNADDYNGLIKQDLEKLKQVLDICHQQEMPVIITMLSLPGSRWKQNNHDKYDLRIWQSQRYQDKAADFWQDLASALKDHPAVVGYNILNEPYLERIFSSKEANLNTVNQEEVQKILHNLYSRIIKQIRLVDKRTPIILDSSAYADAKTFQMLTPQEDKNTLYSFHMYEPYEYTNHVINKGKFQYPGLINQQKWNRQALEEYMATVANFQKKYNIASNKILVGEFGANRASPGLEKYFQDLIAIFNKQGWHFAFYAFREDTWGGMDYELGAEKLPASYWKAIESGEKPRVSRKSNYGAFSILKEALQN